jgi:hypothetical protein
MCVLKWKQGEFAMISEPKIERRKKQRYAAIRMAVPIPFGKYLQPAGDEVYHWMKSKDIKPSGPAIIRYLTTDMSRELDIDVGFTVDKAVKATKASPPTFCRLAVTRLSSTLDPTRAMASSKRPWPCWIGPRKTKSNGMSQRKKVSSGGTGGLNSISPIPP